MMIKAIVKKVFADKMLGTEYAVGDVIYIKDEARMNDLEFRGLALRAETVAEKKATQKKVGKAKE